MTGLTRWNPTRDFLNITDEMNRLVDVFRNGGSPETSLFKGTWHPVVDISEDNNNFYLQVELPGLKREEVKVKYEEGMLTISGEKNPLEKSEELNFHRIERGYGRFERSFRITSKVLADKITAEFKHGVLWLTLPKAEESKPKEIEIKIK